MQGGAFQPIITRQASLLAIQYVPQFADLNGTRIRDRGKNLFATKIMIFCCFEFKKNNQGFWSPMKIHPKNIFSAFGQAVCLLVINDLDGQNFFGNKIFFLAKKPHSF